MDTEIKENTNEVEEVSTNGTQLYQRPAPLPTSKKKKKKKKRFPTDPDDPETDDDFDEDDDDDDDDDDDTTTSTDEDGAEDENELKQLEEKKQNTFKKPFMLLMAFQNFFVKKKHTDPDKPQRSPIQKFFDVLLYGVDGAKIRNGELPTKSSIMDELLLGLGFKAYRRDVLLNQQMQKFLKQKNAGKENLSLFQNLFKKMKTMVYKTPEVNEALKEVKQEIKKELNKSELTVKKDEKLISKIPLDVKKIEVVKETPGNTVKQVNSLEKLDATFTNKSKNVVSLDEKKQILATVEEEEQRIKKIEEKERLRKEAEHKKELLGVVAGIQSKSEQQKEQNDKSKKLDEKAQIVQNDKDQAMMQQRMAQLSEQQAQVSQAMSTSALVRAMEGAVQSMNAKMEAQHHLGRQHPVIAPKLPHHDRHDGHRPREDHGQRDGSLGRNGTTVTVEGSDNPNRQPHSQGEAVDLTRRLDSMESVPASPSIDPVKVVVEKPNGF